jgi:hypothetical protein
MTNPAGKAPRNIYPDWLIPGDKLRTPQPGAGFTMSFFHDEETDELAIVAGEHMPDSTKVRILEIRVPRHKLQAALDLMHLLNWTMEAKPDDLFRLNNLLDSTYSPFSRVSF